ncbi:16S rRNA (cytidine(1402)-2'-O)-methyltransferase [Parathermosynechococcus lividus]|jgi:16S rRNA (cytidine1402-2'-O)-methyltransferase|uniref:Ribosomal RNA small subunit methyltransferase I n=1 Tax=Parathermosynechococcus lividus PCC 6715 TaxID=1917166 RepID=A0A2D2PZ70_PARLV|nr:16S rRNA (cytidine(1402)-2'-O)-methyltransferase [Thermostichus lividus]ATS17544.1 16S rRNA (cytidine(1402)-2'-O)-methyltransferase [Thermostichus lividus PCC 6715]
MGIGQLWVVGTPIGNLEDITARALRVLREVDLIAAEDTRHTGRLLQYFGITTPQISLHAHNTQQRLPHLLAKLHAGQQVALVSDAGLPGVADPGYELIAACIAAAVPVIPIPGANAALTALMAAGLPMARFCFEGFLPPKGRDRQQRLDQLRQELRTMIFYEAPHRLRATLQDFVDTFGGDRPIVLARELTKRYEDFWRGCLAAASEWVTQTPPRGEYTLVVAGSAPTASPISWEQLQTELQLLQSQGLSLAEASRQLAALTGVSRRQLYQMGLRGTHSNR